MLCYALFHPPSPPPPQPLFWFHPVNADAYQGFQQPGEVYGVQGKAQEGLSPDSGDGRDGVLPVQAGMFFAVPVKFR